MRLQMEESREKRIGALQDQHTSNILMYHMLS